MRRTILTDTGVLLAALDEAEVQHERCQALLGSGAAVVVPAPVVVELDWLSRSRGVPPASILMLSSIADGSVLVVDLEAVDYARALVLVIRYADLGLDLVDASIVAVAERLGEDTIATLDRRHFSVVKPLHVDAFTLVP